MDTCSLLVPPSLIVSCLCTERDHQDCGHVGHTNRRSPCPVKNEPVRKLSVPSFTGQLILTYNVKREGNSTTLGGASSTQLEGLINKEWPGICAGLWVSWSSLHIERVQRAQGTLSTSGYCSCKHLSFRLQQLLPKNKALGIASVKTVTGTAFFRVSLL